MQNFAEFCIRICTCELPQEGILHPQNFVKSKLIWKLTELCILMHNLASASHLPMRTSALSLSAHFESDFALVWLLTSLSSLISMISSSTISALNSARRSRIGLGSVAWLMNGCWNKNEQWYYCMEWQSKVYDRYQIQRHHLTFFKSCLLFKTSLDERLKVVLINDSSFQSKQWVTAPRCSCHCKIELIYANPDFRVARLPRIRCVIQPSSLNIYSRFSRIFTARGVF